MSARRFRHLTGRPPDPGDAPFLAALYLATRPDLGALPVPRGVIEGIARHQQALQLDDYARRYPQARTWLVEHGAEPLGRVVLACTHEALRVVDLAVAPGARRQGVARTILLALQDDCRGSSGQSGQNRESGQSGRRGQIALRVRSDNLAARALYAQLGFAVVRDDGITLELSWN